MRSDHRRPYAMSAIARRRWRPQEDVGHRAERIELSGAGRPDLVPKTACRKPRRNRQRAIRPQCRIGRIPDRVDVESQQAGEEHVLGTVAESLCERAADTVRLRMLTADALRGASRSVRIQTVVRLARQT